MSEIEHLEAADRDIGLVAVLFPEQPLVHLRRRKRVRRNEIAAAGEIADDGVGLRQRAAVVEFDRRHLAGAVELEKFRRAGLALERIDGDPAVGQREPGRRPISPSGNCPNWCRRRSSCPAAVFDGPTEHQPEAFLSTAMLAEAASTLIRTCSRGRRARY